MSNQIILGILLALLGIMSPQMIWHDDMSEVDACKSEIAMSTQIRFNFSFHEAVSEKEPDPSEEIILLAGSHADLLTPKDLIDSIPSRSKSEQSMPWSVVVGLTVLTVLPALLLAMTPLVRILVVFHFLRQALGTQTAPSNQVLMGLALMMTWFLIQPVLAEIDKEALAPYMAGKITGQDAIKVGSVPVKHYLLKYARSKDLELFVSFAAMGRPSTHNDLPFTVVVPAYVLSELKAGFEIGALLFLPFLLVDLIVASITTSIGMMQLPPVVISTPLKILLFVMVDGWNFLASQLLKSFSR